MTEKNKMLIVGATGFLGRTLCDLSVSKWAGVPASRNGDGHVALELTDAASVESAILSVRPQWVVNTAAMTSVDGCERDPDMAQAVHVAGTEHLVRACEKAECGLVTVSTNYVFDGEEDIYDEKDAPNPVNVYGQSKLDGEIITGQASCRHIVVRTAVLYGHRSGCRPNFVTWAIGALNKGEPIRVVTDEWANPTYIDDLGQFILDICEGDFQGVVHYGGRDFLTRFEMVERICEVFGFDRGLVTPITSAEFGQPAKRPLRAGLCTDLASQLSPLQAIGFDDSLVEIQKAFS